MEVATGEVVTVGHSESEGEGVTLGVGEDARVVPMGEVVWVGALEVGLEVVDPLPHRVGEWVGEWVGLSVEDPLAHVVRVWEALAHTVSVGEGLGVGVTLAHRVEEWDELSVEDALVQTVRVGEALCVGAMEVASGVALPELQWE